MRFHISFEMHMNLASNKVIVCTDSKDISTFLRLSILGALKPEIKKSYPKLWRLQEVDNLLTVS